MPSKEYDEEESPFKQGMEIIELKRVIDKQSVRLRLERAILAVVLLNFLCFAIYTIVIPNKKNHATYQRCDGGTQEIIEETDDVQSRVEPTEEVSVEPQPSSTKVYGYNIPVGYDAGDEKVYTVSAYNSVVGQTAGDPCESADGTNICEAFEKGECTIAMSRSIPFDTLVVIADRGVCRVVDRLAIQNDHRIDLHMGGADFIDEANAWGVPQKAVTILEKL